MTPLYAIPQWVVVLLVPRPDGRTDKLPLDHRSGNTADAHNPQHWTTHAEALALATAWGPQFTVGFVLTAADDFWCLDIDGALDPATGQWSQLSQQLCSALPGTSIEVSQSGRGLHIWGRGPVPPHSSKNIPLHIELYTERRFIAIGTNAVGEMAPSCPQIGPVAAYYFPPRSVALAALSEGPSPDWCGPADDAELLRRAMQSRSAAGAFGGKATFADLWHADAAVLGKAYPADTGSNEPYDGSSADMALAQHLSFWTGRDVARIERLMRQSKLARAKWDERADYLVERTITTACGQQKDVLQDKPAQPGPGPAVQAPEPTAPSLPTAAPGQPRMTAVTGTTFLGPEQQAALFDGCVYVLDEHRALVPGGRLLKPDQFKAQFGGYSFSMDARNERVSRNAWEAFTESQVLRAPRADSTCFRPALPYGTIIDEAGQRRVNTYWPVKVARKIGDAGPFLRHLAKLLPNPADAATNLYMLAALVQHQGYKFQWAIVLQGVEGNGKTLFSRCVAQAIGARYVHWPKASKLAKQFNGWMVGKTFYAVEDIHTSENINVIEELKPMITGGDGIEIEKKGVDQFSTEVCGNFYFNSNHKSGLAKSANDRRLCIMYCAQQTLADLARDGITGDYMNDLYHWLKHEDGYAIVSELLWTLPIPDEFNPAKGCQRAPTTSSTAEAIEAGRGRIEQEIIESIEQSKPGFRGGWVSSLAVDHLMAAIGRGNSVSRAGRRDMMQAMGYQWHPNLPRGRVNNPSQSDGGKPVLYILNGSPLALLTSAADILAAYDRAQRT